MRVMDYLLLTFAVSIIKAIVEEVKVKICIFLINGRNQDSIHIEAQTCKQQRPQGWCSKVHKSIWILVPTQQHNWKITWGKFCRNNKESRILKIQKTKSHLLGVCCIWERCVFSKPSLKYFLQCFCIPFSQETQESTWNISKDTIFHGPVHVSNLADSFTSMFWRTYIQWKQIYKNTKSDHTNIFAFITHKQSTAGLLRILDIKLKFSCNNNSCQHLVFQNVVF